jgi:hypothetical protein
MMDRRNFALSLAGCAAARWLFQVAKTKPLPTFIDVSSKSRIHFRHQSSRTSQKYLPESMGAGVAMFDYDNDGYQDLFFVNGARLLDPMPNGTSPDKSDSRFWNRLYRNNKDGTFTDVTEKAGVHGSLYGMGVATEIMTTMDTPTCWSPTWAAIPCTGTMGMARSPMSQKKREWAVAGGVLALASWTMIETDCWI